MHHLMCVYSYVGWCFVKKLTLLECAGHILQHMSFEVFYEMRDIFVLQLRYG